MHLVYERDNPVSITNGLPTASTKWPVCMFLGGRRGEKGVCTSQCLTAPSCFCFFRRTECPAADYSELEIYLLKRLDFRPGYP